MILVNNKFAATLEIKTKDECYFIPPRVFNYKLDINEGDIVTSSPKLKIRTPEGAAPSPAPEPAGGEDE